ncbi:type 4 prepilin peptidase 1 Aspartic peptidase. MEROPS family A24A [Kushneria avicenniae]|uniref:Prepilin leader peptidase/N-methyltransferase n=1 Tax=Kushneria avicenniae TaxID=402385 RepID=A0A1I1M4Z5_9GAMM|nr:A24 family peptidase [Kushneria avicenniae]SFC80434.1 type 4 prepilin peptidase 1 Aspartic peptidase. MEROPS family A24A [Kushneria avicenniae]
MSSLTDPLLLIIVALLALTLGSFLNVVIARLPVMLSRQWTREAHQTLALVPPTHERYNLLLPRSHCPTCDTAIAWHDNLPLVGYFKRGGRCAQCRSPISARYPLVEAASLVLVLWIVWHHGLTVSALALSLACLTLLALAVIDVRTLLLPDVLTLPLLWGGLVYQLIDHPDRLAESVIGVVAGYGIAWGFYWCFRLTTGREGLGRGDFKLLAALGAWCGWQALPLILVLSATTGAVIGILMQLAIPRLRGAPMPFGPFLSAAGMLLLLGGDRVIELYHHLIGLSSI